MILMKFFRSIRKSLVAKKNIANYLIYAIGEIFLVVIGILIALQINNWNELNKLKDTEQKYYSNLLTSLSKDSIELVRVLDSQRKSIAGQNVIIASQYVEIVNKLDKKEFADLVYDIYNGAYSFFPKYGTYNSLVSSNGLDVLKSDKIKSDLIDLYDYWFYRYENVDNVVDKKYHDVLYPFLQQELGFFVDAEFKYQPVNYQQLQTAYDQLQLQCQNVNPLTNHSIRQLENIQQKVNEIMLEIRNQTN